MKNKTNSFTQNKFTWHIMLLFLLFMVVSQSFGQSAKTKKTTTTSKSKSLASENQKMVAPTNNVISSEARNLDPVAEMKRLRGDMPIQPQGYTATKVSVSQTAAPEVKADFIKKHGADHYYIYMDTNGKTINKDQYNEAVKIEEDKQNKPK
jgi:hypothetical protein